MVRLVTGAAHIAAVVLAVALISRPQQAVGWVRFEPDLCVLNAVVAIRSPSNVVPALPVAEYSQNAEVKAGAAMMLASRLFAALMACINWCGRGSGRANSSLSLRSPVPPSPFPTDPDPEGAADDGV